MCFEQSLLTKEVAFFLPTVPPRRGLTDLVVEHEVRSNSVRGTSLPVGQSGSKKNNVTEGRRRVIRRENLCRLGTKGFCLVFFLFAFFLLVEKCTIYNIQSKIPSTLCNLLFAYVTILYTRKIT